MNLLFEFFELVVFLLAVVFYFFLRFGSGVLDALGSVCRVWGREVRWAWGNQGWVQLGDFYILELAIGVSRIDISDRCFTRAA